MKTSFPINDRSMRAKVAADCAAQNSPNRDPVGPRIATRLRVVHLASAHKPYYSTNYPTDEQTAYGSVVFGFLQSDLPHLLAAKN
jgi:hypothetical protein